MLRTRLKERAHIDAGLEIDPAGIKNANEFWVIIGSEP
jgi:hypothetical protein